MLKRILSLVLTLASVACGGASSAPAVPRPDAEYSLEQAADSIPLALGRVVKVGSVLLVLNRVSDDSRCPVGAQCVWSGDATAHISIHPGCYLAGCGAPSGFAELHTNVEPRSRATPFGVTLALLSLTPIPRVGTPVRVEAYVAWVRVR